MNILSRALRRHQIKSLPKDPRDWTDKQWKTATKHFGVLLTETQSLTLRWYLNSPIKSRKPTEDPNAGWSYVGWTDGSITKGPKEWTQS